MRSACLRALALAVLLSASSSYAWAKNTDNSKAMISCERAVSVLGASMGHTEFTTASGAPAYRFVVRSNGLDYEVVCDARSGGVSDVAPRHG